MEVIVPVPVTVASLVSSSLEQEEAAPWAEGTSYTAGTRVIRTAPQSVYLVDGAGTSVTSVFEAVGASRGKDPAQRSNVVGSRLADGAKNTAGPWVRVGATNRWKPFDGRVGDLATATGNMLWRIGVTTLTTHVAAFRVMAGAVRVRVLNVNGTETYSQTQQAVDTSHVTDWWKYFTEPPVVRETLVFTGFAALPGDEIEVLVVAESGPRVGEIVLGRGYHIGELLTDASTGYEDYSSIEYDDFGNADVLRRGFADLATFRVQLPGHKVEQVKSFLARHRGQPLVFHGGNGLTRQGMTVLGIIEAPPFTLPAVHVAFLTLDVKGLA